MSFNFQPFLGLRLVGVGTDEFMGQFIAHARTRPHPLTVGYLNAAQVNLAFADAAFARTLAGFDCLYADGQAIVWASRRRGYPVPERINAGDFLHAFAERAAENRVSIALIGGRPDEQGHTGEGSEARRMADVLHDWQPKLDIVYCHHGYLTANRAPAVHAALEAADPDLVLLGMGAPRQEHWAATWSREGRPRVWWCVGALFEYYAGTRRRAPVWMRRAGLEWAFRLAMEPGRLWRRYLIGNPMFVYRVLRGRPPRGLEAQTGTAQEGAKL